jgi:hypothetical protein
MGVAFTYVPIGESTCSPPRASWKSSVIDPGPVSSIHQEVLSLLTVVGVCSCSHTVLVFGKHLAAHSWVVQQSQCVVACIAELVKPVLVNA